MGKLGICRFVCVQVQNSQWRLQQSSGGLKLGCIWVHLDLPALCLMLVDVFHSVCRDNRASYERFLKQPNFQVQCIGWTKHRLAVGQTESYWVWWFFASHPVIPAAVTSSIHVTGKNLEAVTSWSGRTQPILSREAQSHGLHGQFRGLSIPVDKLPNLSPIRDPFHIMGYDQLLSQGFSLCGSTWDCEEEFWLQCLFWW